jgi:hypothetical protein
VVAGLVCPAIRCAISNQERRRVVPENAQPDAAMEAALWGNGYYHRHHRHHHWQDDEARLRYARHLPEELLENGQKAASESRAAKLLWDAAIEEPCFALPLRFWHACRERLARPDQRRLYRKSLQWSQSRLLFPGPNGAPLGRAALHNALRRLNAGGERNSSRPITPEKIRAAFLWRDPL